MNCTQCGTEINLNAKFCHKCGTAIQFESYNNETQNNNTIKGDPVVYLMEINAIANSIYANTNLYIEKLVELSRNFLKGVFLGGDLNEDLKNNIMFLFIEFDKIINQLNSLKPPITEIENLHNEVLAIFSYTISISQPDDINRFPEIIETIKANNTNIKLKIDQIESILKNRFRDVDFEKINKSKKAVPKLYEIPEIRNLPQSQNKSTSSGCFIATAAFGTPNHYLVKELQQFRDRVLVKNHYGAVFIKNYNKYSPILARYVNKSYILKWITIVFILLPSLFFIRILHKLNR